MPDRGWGDALVVTAVATMLRLLLAAWLPLFPDETYYWEWSRHLAAGYYDHPPAIAVLVAMGARLGTLLGAGPSPFFVRLVPVLAGGVATLAAAAIARRIGGGSAARTAAIVFALMPLAATGLVLATPDAPLLATTAVALWFVVRALQAEARSAASTLEWCGAGVMLGLAFTSKYTSILLPITVVVAIVLRPSLRNRLREPGPYLACLLATLVFAPVLLWNADHDWISFRFQLQHGLGTPKGSALKRELDLVGGQLGLVSPIIFGLAAHAVWVTLRRRADDVRFMLAVVATGSWVFFAYSASRRAVEANWPAPSYLPAIALLAALAASPGHARWLRRGIGLAALLVGVVYLHAVHPILPLAARRDPIARSAGWDGLAARVHQTQHASGARTFVAADRYQDVSELAYHLPGQPVVYCVCLTGRHNQYELWRGFADDAKPGDDLLLVLEERSGVHESVALLTPHFTSVTRAELVPVARGTEQVTERRLWRLAGYRGSWPTRSGR